MGELSKQLETIKKERDAAMLKQQAADDKLQNIERKLGKRGTHRLDPNKPGFRS